MLKKLFLLFIFQKGVLFAEKQKRTVDRVLVVITNQFYHQPYTQRNAELYLYLKHLSLSRGKKVSHFRIQKTNWPVLFKQFNDEMIVYHAVALHRRNSFKMTSQQITHAFEKTQELLAKSPYIRDSFRRLDFSELEIKKAIEIKYTTEKFLEHRFFLNSSLNEESIKIWLRKIKKRITTRHYLNANQYVHLNSLKK